MIKEYKNLEIIDKKGKADNFIWDLPFLSIKNHILGQDFDLSLNFIDEALAYKLNIENRKKDYIPNVLTFPLSDSTGEIYICRSIAYKQYKNFNLKYRDYILLLFIHGCLHLNHVDHNTAENEDYMVKLEYELLEKFK